MGTGNKVLGMTDLGTVIHTENISPNLPETVREVIVPDEIMEYISPMSTPQGALFLCRLPEKTAFRPQKGMLILDGIQDPGNLGTMLRTADALNVPVCLLEGCADPYSHKVVRASMGAVFRTPIVQANWEQVKTACKEAGIPVAVTALSDRAKDIRGTALENIGQYRQCRRNRLPQHTGFVIGVASGEMLKRLVNIQF